MFDRYFIFDEYLLLLTVHAMCVVLHQAQRSYSIRCFATPSLSNPEWTLLS